MRLILILMLPLIGILIYWDGQNYDPDLLHFNENASKLPTVAFPKRIDHLIKGNRSKHFDKNNLYEYINGHAEFFINAGFKNLQVAEYSRNQKNNQPSLIINLYNMGKPLHAYGVLMDSVDVSAKPVAVGAMGMQSQRELAFIQGQYFLQIVAFSENEKLLKTARVMEQLLGKSTTNNVAVFDFPDFGEVITTRFIKENYHGLDFLHNIVEKKFRQEETILHSFLAFGSALELTQLENSFVAFFQEDGMKYTQVTHGKLRFYQINDPYEGEWFFVLTGTQLLGVYGELTEARLTKIQAFTGFNDGYKKSNKTQ